MSSLRNQLIWDRPDSPDAFVLVDADVSELLYKYRQSRPQDKESGGLLIGFRRGQHLEIIAATTPMLKDRRSRVSFSRVDPGHQAYISRLWKESHGKIDYLGEWHTHPEIQPSPSSIDRREWAELLRHTAAPLVFLIVGTAGWYMQVASQGDDAHVCSLRSETNS